MYTNNSEKPTQKAFMFDVGTVIDVQVPTFPNATPQCAYNLELQFVKKGFKKEKKMTNIWDNLSHKGVSLP